MCWVQLLTSTISFLCTSIPETLLHVTPERLAEISSDMFSRHLRYLRLSCKNLTITADLTNLEIGLNNVKVSLMMSCYACAIRSGNE